MSSKLKILLFVAAGSSSLAIATAANAEPTVDCVAGAASGSAECGAEFHEQHCGHSAGRRDQRDRRRRYGDGDGDNRLPWPRFDRDRRCIDCRWRRSGSFRSQLDVTRRGFWGDRR